MTYKLARLASGSYDIVLNGVIIASLVRSGPSESATWTAELLVELLPQERPSPFTDPEHTFESLDEARQWLGISETSEGL